jgi:ATP-dependent exoDNAse (exonuclease V) alpha subunit
MSLEFGNKRGATHAHMNLQALSALAVGVRVMLLVNISIELNLLNGSTGTIKHIVYDEASGPNQPAYCIVDFPHFINDQLLIDGCPLTWVPIAPSQIPLCACKALSIHKIQGVTMNDAFGIPH